MKSYHGQLSAVKDDAADVSALESYTGFLLTRAHFRMTSAFTSALAEAEVVPAQFALLNLLEANGGIMASRASVALGMQKANFVRVQSELEARGWIERAPLDRRSFGLHLTKQGKAVLRRAQRLHRKLEAAILAAVGAEGERTLRRLLKRLAEGLSAL